jgi:hypothetical protein
VIRDTKVVRKEYSFSLDAENAQAYSEKLQNQNYKGRLLFVRIFSQSLLRAQNYHKYDQPT